MRRGNPDADALRPPDAHRDSERHSEAGVLDGPELWRRGSPGALRRLDARNPRGVIHTIESFLSLTGRVSTNRVQLMARRRTVIKTPFPSVESVAAEFGIGRKRLSELRALVDSLPTRRKRTTTKVGTTAKAGGSRGQRRKSAS
jgi:hypothetical protein